MGVQFYVSAQKLNSALQARGGVRVAKDASFDIVSETEMQEVQNAVSQAQKELQARFDFKGSKSSLELSDDQITAVGDDEYKLTSVLDVLQSKLVRRGVSLEVLDYGKVEQAAQGTVRQTIKIKQGIDPELAKRIVKTVKDTRLKVQASIQGQQVRVTGKNRDDLQLVIKQLKEIDFATPLQFVNYR